VSFNSFNLRRVHPVPFHLLMLALCSWAISVQFFYRLPGSFLIFLLPMVSTAVGLVTAVILITYLMGRTPVEDPWRKIFHHTENLCRIFVIAFCYYSLFLFANAKWDSSLPEDHLSDVLKIGGSEIDLVRSFHYSYAELRSWSHPKRSEWLLLHGQEEGLLYENQSVVVQTRRGFFNVPWVSSVEPDREKQLRAVLSITPNAARAWQELIEFYLNHRRWAEATRAGIEFFRIYPHDREGPEYIAVILNNARQFNHVIALLEPLVSYRREYKMYIYLGFALVMTGKKSQGIEFLKSAIELDPNDYFGYYELGYAHLFTGEPRLAIPYFEKVLQLWPNYPEIEERLRQIKRLTAEQKTQS
jgi:tetratricopeptide (TPR) repeat protein